MSYREVLKKQASFPHYVEIGTSSLWSSRHNRPKLNVSSKRSIVTHAPLIAPLLVQTEGIPLASP